jgi:hypothetical protein
MLLHPDRFQDERDRSTRYFYAVLKSTRPRESGLGSGSASANAASSNAGYNKSHWSRS